MPLVSVYEISSLWLASVTEQACFGLTWSEILKTDFLGMTLTIALHHAYHV